MNCFLIDSVLRAPIWMSGGRKHYGSRTMKTIHKVAIASTFAFSALALTIMTAPLVQAGPIVPPGHYCLSYDEGGTDCSFSSYAQCEATASGLDAECYGKTARDDENESLVAGGHPGFQYQIRKY